MKSSFLSLFLFCLFFLPETKAFGQNIKTITFNVRYDNPDDEHPWEKRKRGIAWLLKEQKPDVIGIQEALLNQVDDLKALLPEYYAFGVGRDDGQEEGEFSPIFYRKDSWILLESETFWLSEEQDEPGSIGWDAVLPRIVTQCRLQHNTSGKELIVLNTHLDHEGTTSRLESARMLRNKIQFIDNNIPLVLMGDFNFDDQSDAYDALAVSGIKDVQKSFSGGFTPTGTFNYFDPMNTLGPRIDYIFTREKQVVIESRILPLPLTGTVLSDHFPVMARLKL